MKSLKLTAFALLFFLSTFAAVVAPSSSAAAANPATVAYERRIDSQTLDIYVQSPSTDSWVKEVRLLLPKNWDRNSAKKWPTLWLLHGGKDDYTSLTKGTDIEELVANRDMMVVIPNTSWCSQYTDWWNYGNYGSPAWETYITSDLRNLLDNKYNADENNATIAGVSMGGLGAFKLAMNHPDMFKGAASFSGNVDPLHAYNNSANGTDPATAGCLGVVDWRKIWGDNAIPEQKAIWERNDPYVQADKFAKLDYVFLSSGDGNSDPLAGKASANDYLEHQVRPQTQALAEKFKSLNIKADSDFYSGIHNWPYWQIELHKALPGLLDAMHVN